MRDREPDFVLRRTVRSVLSKKVLGHLVVDEENFQLLSSHDWPSIKRITQNQNGQRPAQNV